MPLFELRLAATLEGVRSIAVAGADHNLHVTLLCGCGDRAPRASVLSWSSTTPIPGSRGEAHLVQKCRGCGRTITVEITSPPEAARLAAPEGASPTEAVEVSGVLAVLDVRGGEPANFDVAGGWVVESASGGARWASVDLTGGEFSE
jgi:hypothetical protein